MHLMQRQRRHIISIFVTFSRKMFLRLRLKFHPEFFGGEHNVVIQEWIGGDTKMDHSCNSRSRREKYVKCR